MQEHAGFHPYPLWIRLIAALFIALIASFFWWVMGLTVLGIPPEPDWLRVLFVTVYCGDGMRKFVFWPEKHNKVQYDTDQ